ncbi:MAG: PKD domain-containing protein [Bacteroidota bacterium]|nr:PKD domain-containing protein [Bacteroidota bacterium]
MRKHIQILSGLTIILSVQLSKAQSTYNSTDLSANGDTLYLTSSQLGAQNFDTTGANVFWDYSMLIGNGQRVLEWRAPNQTGFSFAQWPYLYNASNVNTSSTDGRTIMIGNLQYSDPNDYYLKNSLALEQRASSYKISVGSTAFNVKNVYTSADVIYKFPLNYGNIDSSQASFTTSISTLYYRESSIKRVNKITGWGSVTTPYGSFANVLKLESYSTQIDSIAVDTLQPVQDTIYTRELKWLDPSKGYPVLTVTQIKVGNNYVTNQVEYIDNKQYFQPAALFVYYPVSPFMGDTVLFQNLSTDATTYAWEFGDPSSGVNNTSASNNPEHQFVNPGIYNVKLIAHNGPLSDTIVLPINVRDTIPPTAGFTYSPVTIYEGDTVSFTNTSTHYTVSAWNFGDPGSGSSNISSQDNPTHAYAVAGTYMVRMIAGNSISTDTLDVTLIVNPLSVSIKTISSENQLEIYPVPATDELTVYYQSKNNEFSVTIFNALGKKVIRENNCVNGKLRLDTSALSSGVYYLYIRDDSVVVSKKIIITK